MHDATETVERQRSWLRRRTARGFALEEHPRTIVVMAVFVLLAVYAVVDTFITPTTAYASTPPYALFILCGAVLGGICFLWLRKGVVPRTDAAGMAALIGVACACALYPGLLRISEIHPAGPFHTYDYRLNADLAPPFRTPG